MKTFLFLLLLLSIPAFAQADLPDKGSLAEIKGKTKFYLITDDSNSEKHILKQVVKHKSLTVVMRADDAEFFIEYRTLKRAETGRGIAEMLSEQGQMDIFYRRNGRKVIVWSDVHIGGMPYRSLAKKAMKILLANL